MKKIIYMGFDQGIYKYFDFENFMHEKKAEEVKRNLGSLLGKEETFQIWMLDGTLVHYKLSNNKASVTLHDRKSEKLEDVGKLILEEAKKYFL